MEGHNPFNHINSVLTDVKIINDVRTLLASPDFKLSEDGSVIVDGEKRFVPDNIPLSVVGKILYSWNFEAAYGQRYYRVKVALGEMRDTKRGWVEARYGFIVLMYAEDTQLMKSDWCEQFEFDD